MSKFEEYYDFLLTEFNVEHRNDTLFYDYAVLFVKQLLQRNMIEPDSNVHEIATNIVKKQIFNYIDEEEPSIQYKVEFVFDDNIEVPNNLTVIIKELPSGKILKTVEDTHDESTIKDIVDFIQDKEQDVQQAGISAPEQVGETPSEMPGAINTQPDQGGAPGFSNTPQQPPNTSQYISGLR